MLSSLGLSTTGLNTIALFAIVMACTLAFTEARADKIYKIVDENGKVTYSSVPPDNTDESSDTSTIDITPPPSEERKQAARQRHERNMNTAEQMDENRTKRNAIIAEENRLKRERQKQAAEQFKQDEPASEKKHYGYPHLPPPMPPIRPQPPIAVPLQQ